MEAFWEMLGARPRRMEAPAHDRMMAWVSHLPQLTSNALALALMKAGLGPAHLGPGGRDMTRLAGSGAEMWEDLLQEDEAPLLEALGKLEGELAGLRELLAQGKTTEVGKIMTRTASWLKEGA